MENAEAQALCRSAVMVAAAAAAVVEDTQGRASEAHSCSIGGFGNGWLAGSVCCISSSVEQARTREERREEQNGKDLR